MRTYRVTIGDDEPLTRTPPDPFAPALRAHRVLRVNLPTRTGLGALGSGGFVAGLRDRVDETPTTVAPADDCDGCT